jgi:hypothetical protein
LLVVNSGCSVSFHHAANGVCARPSTKRSRNTGASDLMLAPVPTATYYSWRPQRLLRRVRRTETGSHLRKTILCRLSRSATGREDDASQRAAPVSGISPKGPVDVELCSHLTVTMPDTREHVVNIILVLLCSEHFQRGPTALNGGTTPRADWGWY